MKSDLKILLFFFAATLLAAAASPWAAALFDRAAAAVPAFRSYLPPFSRVFDRLLIVATLAGLILCRRWLGMNSHLRATLRPEKIASRLALGFLLAWLSVAALAGAMWLAGVFVPYFRLPVGVALERTLKAIAGAFAAGFIEEIVFRGFVLRSLLVSRNPFAAYLTTNLTYAVVHFVDATHDTDGAVDPLTGFVYLLTAFKPFLDPAELLPGVVGLFLIGLVLSHAAIRSGSLYLSIGLHAGWIFAVKTLRVFGDYRKEDLGWLFGASEPKLVSGVAAWIGIAVVGIVVHRFTRGQRNLR
jgi:hypothetical protein